MNGMTAHQLQNQGWTSEWLTPPSIIQALGAFDLDPCSPVDRPWDSAVHHYTVKDNGLQQPWFGRVWLNPPYGKETGKWLAKMAEHGNGIALIFARTETKSFFDHVWPKAYSLLFLKGRLYFHRPDGSAASHNSGAPSVLVAYGRRNSVALAASGLPGAFISAGVYLTNV